MISRISVVTGSEVGFYDIGGQVQNIIASSGIVNGLCSVFVPHTTAAITINEDADPNVLTDLMSQLELLVPGFRPYRHAEGNSPAHIKASLLGHSINIPVIDGRLGLGTWQGLFLAEFDGPRQRTVIIQAIQDSPSP